MIRYGILGAGWRAEFYLRIAALLPERFTVSAVCVRNPEKRAKIAEKFAVPVVETVDALLATAPDFVVSCVDKAGIAPMIEILCERGVPVLSETPAGADIQQAERLLAVEKPSWRVQVAEQFHLMPRHLALKKVCDSGILGRVHFVYLSLCHDYHAVSLIRHYLDVGNALPAVSSTEIADSLTKYNGRNGIFTPEKVVATRKTALLDYGDKTAVYDFAGEQYFSAIRGSHLLIRGENGEICDNTCTYLDGTTPMQFSLHRNMGGSEENLDGLFLDSIVGNGQVWYTNPFGRARLSDEEIAIATCLLKMDTYLKTGDAFYSLCEAVTDVKTALLF